MAGLHVGLVGHELAGRYRISSKLGEGGMGLVYRAWDAHLSTEVVVKVPRESLLSDQQFVNRFTREVQSLVRLSHPHVVGILDVGNHNGLPFVVLNYLAGGSLKERHDNGQIAAPSTLQSWLLPIAEALDFIHGQHYIHRDVKPANILFAESGYVYLSDFGVVKVSQEFSNDSSTQTGGLCGTPAYMAPEMFTGQPCDYSVDQYALAVSIYELLAGMAPFDGLPIAVLIARKTAAPIPPLHEASPRVPRALSAAVARAMSVDPAARFPDCVSFAQAVLQSLPPPSSSPRLAGAQPNVPSPVACPACRSPVSVQVPPGTKRLRCTACATDLYLSTDRTRLDRVVVATADPDDAAILRVGCPWCQRRLRISSGMWDKSIRCPGCSQRCFAARDGVAGPKGTDEVQRPRTINSSNHAPNETMADAHNRATAHGRVPARRPRARPRRRRWLLLTLLLFAFGAGAAYFLWPVSDAPDEPVTRDDVITGMVKIDFDSREKRDRLKDAKDVYRIDLRVQTRRGKRVVYSGTIERTEVPVVGANAVGGSVELNKFQISLSAEPLSFLGRPVEDKITPLGGIGNIVGKSKDGLYEFKNLRATSPGCIQNFSGDVQGKNKKHKVNRVINLEAGGEFVRIAVKESDPMSFKNLVLPADDALGIPETTVTGDLVYDYEEGSYYTDSLDFTSANRTDRVRGIIQWKKDDDYPNNGRSKYLFNLLFNPKVGDGAKASTATESERSLLDFSPATSALRGSVEYVDELQTGRVDGETEPEARRSVVTYHLHARQLTPIQIHTFLRVWLLMSGPVNDE